MQLDYHEAAQTQSHLAGRYPTGSLIEYDAFAPQRNSPFSRCTYVHPSKPDPSTHSHSSFLFPCPRLARKHHVRGVLHRYGMLGGSPSSTGPIATGPIPTGPAEPIPRQTRRRGSDLRQPRGNGSEDDTGGSRRDNPVTGRFSHASRC